MSKKTLAALAVAGFVIFVGILTFQMLGHRQNRVEVCMTFEGRNNCSIASGTTREEAVRTATDAACTLIASGVTETTACTRQQPASVKWLD
jgi:hypothetical protein